LRGSEAFRAFTVSSLAGRLAVVPLIYIFVTREEHVWIAAGLTGLGTALVATLTILAARRQRLVGHPDFGWRRIRLRLGEGSTMFAAELLKNVYASGLMLLLALTSGTYQAGLYSGADRTRWPFASLLNPIVMVAYPKMSMLAAAGHDNATRTALSLVRVQALVGLAIAAGLVIVAPVVVDVLLGDAFHEAVPVLRVLAMAVPFVALNGALGMLVMLPYGLNREYMLCLGAGALAAILVGPALCLSLAALGASVALLLSEAVAVTAMWLVLRRRFEWLRLSGSGR
jgi:O-antigen/teichoic acid export membrane protein